MNAVVFAGPTLPASEVRRVLGCVVLPPARQGDVWRAVRRWRPAAIGLIDGVFQDAPAVWHHELLWALAQGVAVWGAASMGALRAAELQPFGMQGAGRIFAAYRDGIWPGFPEPFEDDDEVAVIHAPAEAGFVPLSDAMVDVRATLLTALAAGAIGTETCPSVAAAVKRRHFAERRLSEAAPPALAAWLHQHGMVAQKRLDAMAMLQTMAAAPAATPPAFRFERTLVWERFERQAMLAERRSRALVLEAAGQAFG